MSKKIGAVAKVATKEPIGDGQTRLTFQADYNDERNKEWAKYTPAFAVQMNVLDEVAENFEQGETYLVTFKRRRDDDDDEQRDGRTRDRDHDRRRHELDDLED